MSARRKNKAQVITEEYGGRPYSYLPLGKYVVAASGVCGGRPTIKYTRLDARHVVGMIASGESAQQIARTHHIPVAAVEEAVRLATQYDYETSYA